MSQSSPSLSRTDRRAHEQQLLRALGLRVRYLRDMRGMSRKLFAEASHVSSPHIGRLEAGHGNVSVLVLDRLARALGVPVESMLSTEPADASTDRALIIALLGIRGAGKSSVGEALACKLRLPFVELDHEIQAEAGMNLEDIFALYGQTGYRTLERRVLERVLLQHKELVLATGGGIVTDPSSYELLMRACYTVWLYATHDIYWERLNAQGDRRIGTPAIHRTALASSRKTMAARHKLYSAAQLAVDSSNLSVAQVVREVAAAVKSAR